MMGEELNAADVTERGLLGDRAFALVDPADGKVASAKSPRKWPNLFDFRAALAEAQPTGETIPTVRITLPDGTTVTNQRSDLNEILSKVFGRPVAFESTVPEAPTLEEYWPDLEGLDYRDTTTEESMPPGTFFDLAVVHILTTATIDHLRALYPQGRFEVRRFRPNIVVQPASEEKDFVENAWVGSTLAIGDQVRLSITGPCPRCVMTTLPRGIYPMILAFCAQRLSTIRFT